jgi:hypothetical protein
MNNKYQDVLDSLDEDLANVGKAELGDWACANYQLIREALALAASQYN